MQIFCNSRKTLQIKRNCKSFYNFVKISTTLLIHPSNHPSHFFPLVQFLISNNSYPKQYPKSSIPSFYRSYTTTTLFLHPYIYIHSIEQLISLKEIRKKWIPPPPSIPLDAFHVREIDLSPPSINQEQAQSRNLEWPALHPRKPPPVAVTLGQGKDARPSLMQLHHFMRARIGSRCTSR